jgi:hypothetical protein
MRNEERTWNFVGRRSFDVVWRQAAMRKSQHPESRS